MSERSDSGKGLRITEGGLDDARVQELIAHHFATARAQTAQVVPTPLNSANCSRQMFASGLLGRATRSLASVR